ncbi:MAG: hypothetical protein MP439_10895 [Ferrimicrobium sp.]|jgi:hypothetical protein|nr:hypothetical protein [Ferrimicrobium sp.]
MRLTKRGCRFGRSSKEFKVHRREVRRALASAIPPERKSAPKVRPKLGAYESTVRAWLTEDLKVPKKQRHSATRIWQRLVDEKICTSLEELSTDRDPDSKVDHYTGRRNSVADASTATTIGSIRRRHPHKHSVPDKIE